MTMRRWFLFATAVVIAGGADFRCEIHAAQRDAGTAPPELGSQASVVKGGGSESGWEARSLEEDPADLKGERVRAMDAEPLAVDRGAKGLEQMLQKLGTRASLMMIVAHPDDEDGGMLTYESRGQGARVGMLTLTRGEGGQNVVTGDFNEALGLVRTRELLAADRYMGVDQMFGTEVDFGFSKTKEEAFAQWTHERVLYDAVRAVRLYRPLVVASVFIGAPTDGHGQHQVSGEMAQEVFTAAADPKVFPEMGLPVWAPAKVYGRVPFARINEKGMFDYATGKFVPARFYNYVTKTWSNTTPPSNVTVPEGEPSAVLGKSYVQFAREGLALQRTQIGGGMRVAPAGRFDVGYTLYGSRVGNGATIESERNFFDNVDVTLAGTADLAGRLSEDKKVALRRALQRVGQAVDQASADLRAGTPQRVPLALRDGLLLVQKLVAQVEGMRDMDPTAKYDVLHELRVKEVQFNEALVLALGLSLRAESTDGYVVAPATGVQVPVEVVNGGGERVELRGYEVVRNGVVQAVGGADAAGSIKAGGRSAAWEFQVNEPGAGEAATRPVFSRTRMQQPYYDVQDPRMRDAALSVPAAQVFARVGYGGATVRLARVAMGHRAEDGTVQPLMFEPGLSVSMIPAAGVVPLSETSFPLTVRVKSAERDGAQGTVQLDLPGGWRSEPSSVDFKTAKAGEEAAIPFRVTPGPLGESTYTLTALAMSRKDGKEYKEGYHAVGYPGLVRDNLYAPATYRARGVDVKLPPRLRVAYLPGTGDAVQASIEGIGIHATTLRVADIAAGKLLGFDALVMGVRTYAAQRDLPSVTDRLTEFANGGGVVVVQYQTPEYDGADAPYPLSLGGAAEKVVEEDARVELLAPASQVLSWPNKISESDFEGWVEERGHGFMGEWDSRYEAVTEVQDPGQDPQRGGLLVGRVGKGAYVYCAYALYRQLPEGVPGAFRLVANMVSLGKRP